MKATELVDSIDLLLGRGLDKEAHHLFKRIKKESPGLLSQQGWQDLGKHLPPGPPGMPKGHRIGRERCPLCGRGVARNWVLRHQWSGCRQGVR